MLGFARKVAADTLSLRKLPSISSLHYQFILVSLPSEAMKLRTTCSLYPYPKRGLAIDERYKTYRLPTPPYRRYSHQEKCDIFERWIIAFDRSYENEEEKKGRFAVYRHDGVEVQLTLTGTSEIVPYGWGIDEDQGGFEDGDEVLELDRSKFIYHVQQLGNNPPPGRHIPICAQ